MTDGARYQSEAQWSTHQWRSAGKPNDDTDDELYDIDRNHDHRYGQYMNRKESISTPDQSRPERIGDYRRQKGCLREGSFQLDQ